jgi:pimeloyl-ACP methyl ester carboxylesterase
MAESFQISVTQGIFQVHKWGQGPKVLVALHGFRQNGQAFAKMATTLPTGTTLLAPDLPYHGGTQWHAAEYKPEDIELLITELLWRTKAEHFHLLGFSLGGQLAVGLAIRFKLPIKQLTLLAPDTPKTKWGRFTFGMPYPWRLTMERLFNRVGGRMWWADRLFRYKIIDRFTLTFLNRNLADARRRKNLFGTWRARAHFPFSFRAVRDLSIPVRVVLGKKDSLIPAKSLAKKFRGLDVEVLEGGHDLLRSAVDRVF